MELYLNQLNKYLYSLGLNASSLVQLVSAEKNSKIGKSRFLDRFAMHQGNLEQMFFLKLCIRMCLECS